VNALSGAKSVEVTAKCPSVPLFGEPRGSLSDTR